MPRPIGLVILMEVCLLGAADLAAQDQATAKPLIEDYVKASISPPPVSLGLDPFYKKYIDAHGIPILTSEKVPDAALLVARDIVTFMLSKRPDIREEMIRKGRRVAIMGHTEVTMDIPEYRSRTIPAITDPRLTPGERQNYDSPGGLGSMTAADYWNRRGRGYGGSAEEKTTTGAEENVLGYPGTRYFGEHILVHEFSHAIMGHGIRGADSLLYAAVQQAYRDAMAAGKYRGHYASNNAGEYWAEGVQWFVWSNYEWRDGDTRVFTPEEFKAYDPVLYELISRVIPGNRVTGDVYHGKGLRNPRRTG